MNFLHFGSYLSIKLSYCHVVGITEHPGLYGFESRDMGVTQDGRS